jgi:uncharacterized protein YciU (UPF0263 family)
MTREHIGDLGQKFYVKLFEVAQSELNSIQEEECIDCAYNLALSMAYGGYRSEIKTISGQLESILGVEIHPAPDGWDRTFNIDFYIEVEKKFIGLQIKPISSGQASNQYQWIKMHEVNHEKFRNKSGGQVFSVYIRSGKKKKIYNVEVIEEIRKEIERLKEPD